MRTHKRLWTWIVALVMLVGVLAPQAYAVDEPGGTTASTNPIADDSTLTQWANTIDESSKNAGRIWTDKTVQTGDVTLTGGQSGSIEIEKSNDANFLVGLSALSSASTSTTTQSQPLDVVLVLDTSGSMANSMGTGTYTYFETYDPTPGWFDSNRYYILLDGSYVEVEPRSSWPSTSWYCQGRQVFPKTSANDTNPNHVQFYDYSNSKMAALKNAVSGLIDYTDGLNASITDENQKHRIALVEYASDSYVLTDFTSNAATLKQYVSELNGNGATAADFGLQTAERVVTGQGSYKGARDDAKTVVIFFTDGEPNHNNGFDSGVANDAVTAAKSLKGGGATIYSVGIFAGANPSYTDTPDYDATNTQKSNAFMHAVSSNFPNATSYTDRGQRAENSEYYLATQDSEELNDIFQAIIEDSVAAAPPTVVGGDPTMDGYITFTDELGPYMEVKDFNSVVYAGVTFNNKTASGDGTKYTFTGSVSGNPIYKDADLNDLIIEVQKSDKAEEGDIVTVKIPASLIPLRYYDVQEENGALSMEINPAYPIRVFYSVGLKNNVLTTDGKVDSGVVSDAYINANTDANGNVKFYANSYTTDNEYGDAEATFYPAATNAFYYYTENTPLYTDEDCLIPAKSVDANGTYYYKHTYYVNNSSGNTTQQTEGIAVTGLTADYVAQDTDGNYYVLKGKGRVSRASAYRTDKGNGNKTGTSLAALYPTWDTDAEGKEVASIRLGNNGVVTAPKPTGSLTISKTVEAASGLTAPANAQFTFTVFLKDASDQALTGRYNYTGSNDGTISDGGELKLAAGEAVTIEGLPVGAKYTVTEKDLPDGFSTEKDTIEGTIASGDPQTAAFTNTYSATPYTLDGAANLTVTKVLNGRDWQTGDAFTFKLEGADTATTAAITSGAIEMPANTELTISSSTAKDGDSVTDAFGNITFKKPGEYKFKVTEEIPTDAVGNKKNGVTYDSHAATITVNVTDNGQGALTAAVSTDGSMTFTNTYAVDSTVTVEGAKFGGTKTLNGRDSLLLESFDFTLTKTFGEDTGLTMGATTASVTGLTDGVEKGFSFGDITFSKVGTYTFEVKETLPAGAQSDPYTLNGVTYDHHTGTVTVDVTDVNPKTQLKDGKLYATVTPEGMSFVNSYAPAPVTYGAGNTLLGGTKTLNDTVGNHPLTENMFTFTMTAQSADAPLPSGTGVTTTGTVAKVGNAAPVNGQNTATYDFGELTFTKAGTYRYYIAEERNTLPGVDYDPTTYEVTFDVSDEQATGKLTVTASAKKLTDSTGGTTGGTDVAMDALDFNNTYSAGPVKGSTTLQKTLDGRNFQTGDQFVFNVTMTATHQGAAMTNDELPQPTPVSGGTIDYVKTENNTLSYTITINPNDYTKDVWQFSTGTFNYSQVGTYVFTITEQQGSLDGVTYDTASYEVTVTITETQQEGGQPVLHRDIAITKDGTPFTGSTISFTNTYAAEGKLDGNANLMVTKKLTGREWLDSDTFTFAMEGEDQTTKDAIDSGIIELPANLEITNKGTVVGTDSYQAAFGDITFHKAGTYVFLIKEAEGNIGGMTYDTSARQITVSVADNGDGTLTASLAAGAGTDPLTFTNTYTAAPVSLTIIGHKNIENKVIQPPVSTNEEPAEGTTEEKSTEATTDEESNEATTEDESTEDKATVTTPEDETAEVTTEDKATVTTPEGETTTEDKAAVTTTEDVTSEDKATTTPTEDKSTEVATEDKSAETTTEDESTEATTEDKATVTTTEDESAATVAAPTAATEIRTTAVTTAAVRPAMATATRATTDLRLVNITDNTVSDEDGKTENPEVAPLNLDPAVENTWEFTYEMVKLDENDQETTEKWTATSTGEADFDFPALTFDHAGTYKYVIREVKTGAGSYIEYDKSEYILTVTVTDNKQGNLLETHTLTLNGATVQDNKPVFTNYYSAQPIPVDVSADLAATKVLNGRTMKAGEFTFEIKDIDGVVVSEGTNDANGDIKFNSWYYTMDETGTHNYTVSEVTDNLPGGVSANDETYTFTVTVEDDNQGNLSATVDKQNQNIVFTNTYTATDATVPLTASKILTGKPLSDQEFSFTLTGDKSVSQEKTNDADGNVTFDPLTFTLADLDGETEKTFSYVVAEVNDGQKGMTYDSTQYSVDIKVTDDGQGTLTADVTYTANNTQMKSMSFTNRYQPLELDYKLPQATKTLNGRNLADGEFQFVVEMQDTSDPAQPWKWNQIAETVNEGENIVFDPVKITQVGNYTLRVREVNNKLSGVTYDTTVYYLTMTVYDDNGQLKAENVKITRGDIGQVGTEEAAISFVNTYTAPDDGSDDDSNSDSTPASTPAPTATPAPAPAPTATPAPTTVIPQTGDAMPVTTLVVLMVVAAALLVTLVVVRKRRNK